MSDDAGCQISAAIEEDVQYGPGKYSLDPPMMRESKDK